MSIIDHYAGAIVDVDGVIFRGDEPVKEAITFLRRSRASLPTVYVTNNSFRTRDEWSALFGAHKIDLEPAQLLSSADAAAALLAADPAPRCLVLGGPGLHEALDRRGVPRVDAPDEAEAVVVGWTPELEFRQLRDAARAIGRGARFVGTNPDPVYPGPDGPLPGNGAALAYLRAATGVAAEVGGKPQPHLFELAGHQLGVDGPILAVGDQIETDVLAASRMGWDSALVLSGVASWVSLIGASPSPTWVVRHLAELEGPEPPQVRHAREADVTALRDLMGEAGFAVDGVARRLRETLVAEDPEEAIVGTTSWELLDDAAHLRGVVVTQTERGHGTGSHLVVRALAELEQAGVRWAYLLTPGADELFAKLGFFEVTRDRVPDAVLATAEFGAPDDQAHALVRRLGRGV